MFQIFLGRSRRRLLSPSLLINLGSMKLSVAPESTSICLSALAYCYVFLTYYCAHNGLPLGPSFLLRHPLPSRTDYDSSLIPIVTHY
jgi:hypothetical protein